MPKPVITPEIEAAFDKCRDAQNAFWEALRELEDATGIMDISGEQDFSDMTTKDLFDDDGPDEGWIDTINDGDILTSHDGRTFRVSITEVTQ